MLAEARGLGASVVRMRQVWGRALSGQQRKGSGRLSLNRSSDALLHKEALVHARKTTPVRV